MKPLTVYESRPNEGLDNARKTLIFLYMEPALTLTASEILSLRAGAKEAAEEADTILDSLENGDNTED